MMMRLIHTLIFISTELWLRGRNMNNWKQRLVIVIIGVSGLWLIKAVIEPAVIDAACESFVKCDKG